MKQVEDYSEHALKAPPKRAEVIRYEESVPIRGCGLSLENIKGIYKDMSAINRKFGQQLVAELSRTEEMSDVEWEKHKAFLLQDAFCLTVTISGERDEIFYGENAEIFDNDDLPNPIRTIYFNNVTAWRRHANNSDPGNRLDVVMDFGKPALFDPSSILSEPTPNRSAVTVRADDMTYFRAIQQVVDTKLLNHRTWYAAIHRPFAYDFGLWAIALPGGLILATYYMEKWLPVGSDLAPYRWAFFLYALGLVVLGYRFLSGYVKWAFPVNVLTDNKDKALRHRVTLGAIFAWLAYKGFDAIYGVLPFAP